MRGTTVIFGADGYIGWPLALHLGVTGDSQVVLVDNFVTRRLVESVQSDSLVPIRTMKQRLEVYRKLTGKDNLVFESADARDPDQVDSVLRRYRPSSVVHLAQQRSAPFSMIDQDHALYTQLANTATNLNIMYSMARNVPDAHLVKMGTMGEYGTPGVEIKEGEIEIKVDGRKTMAMFPRSPGSWYHISKVFDTFNVLLANKLYSLTATDVMQGVVYGTRIEEVTDDSLATRFDFDSIWGTVINKYVIQAVLLKKLLIYGKGRQRRGFLSLYDSINCLTLLIDNPPQKGRYRLVNQLDEVLDTVTLAEMVQRVASEYGIIAEMERVPNPRVEAEDHYYKVESKILPSLGFRRQKSMEQVLHEIFETVISNRGRAEAMKRLIYPTVSWKSTARAVPEFQMPQSLLSPFSREQILRFAQSLEVGPLAGAPLRKLSN